MWSIVPSYIVLAMLLQSYVENSERKGVLISIFIYRQYEKR